MVTKALGIRVLDEAADPVFKVIELVAEPVRSVPRVEALRGHRLYRGRDGFIAAIPETVVLELLAFAKRAAPKEWIGIVMVELCEDPGGRFVVVHGVVPDDGAVAEITSVRTTTESEFRTRRLGEVLFPGSIPGGWCHSHPRYGVWFSAMDRETQATWNEPHALGIVVDPWDAKEIAVFRGPDAELLENASRVGDAAPTPRPTPLDRSTSDAARSEAPRRRQRRRAWESSWAPALPLATVGLAIALMIFFVAMSRKIDDLGMVIAGRVAAPTCESARAALPDHVAMPAEQVVDDAGPVCSEEPLYTPRGKPEPVMCLPVVEGPVRPDLLP